MRKLIDHAAEMKSHFIDFGNSIHSIRHELMIIFK